MDAIKKKMQAMKAEKDNAMDRADTCEQQSRDANLRAEKVRFEQNPCSFFTNESDNITNSIRLDLFAVYAPIDLN